MGFKKWESSLVIGKNPCYNCRKDGRDHKGDNFHYYGEEEGGHCFSCGWSLLSEAYKEENGLVQGKIYEEEGTLFDETELERIKSEYEWIDQPYRGIYPSTYKYFGVMHKVGQDGGLLEQIYPTFKGSNLQGFKRRILPKTFAKPYGDVKREVDFFGQFRFLKSQSRDVIISAGEIDCMSIYQVLKEHTDSRNSRNNTDFEAVPVVSSTLGEEGTKVQAQLQYDWLNRFERILVCFDDDAAGKKALEGLFSSLPKGKMFVMELHSSDANECLDNGDKQKIINAYYKAKPYAPVGVLGSSSLAEKILEHASIEKIPLPPYMHRLQDLMAGGIPLGVIVNLISSSGTGKSTHVDEIIYHWIFNSPYKIGIMSLESDSGEYGTKLLSRHVGRKINLIKDVEEKINFLNREDIVQQTKYLFTQENGQDRFMLVEDRDGSVEEVKETVERMVTSGDVKVVVIDPLQDLIACLPDDAQNQFMSWQKGMVKSHGITFFNVNHTKKSLTGGGAGSQGVDLVEEDTHGSSSIYKSGACNLLFSRDKEAEDIIVRNTTIMKMSKCRWTGNTTPFAGKYYYDNRTHTVHDFDDWKEKHPEMFVTEQDG